jgi:RimJ/RimL family protein N-acetyltransferase
MFTHPSGIVLRKLQREELPFLLALKSDSGDKTHRVSILNEEDQNAWFDSLSHEAHCPTNLILTAIKEGPIGVFKLFSIDWQNRSCEVGWDLFEPYRGKGLGKGLVQAGRDFAFQVLNLRRLDAEILSFHEASQKCAAAAGFLKEGVRRKAVWKRDSYYDSFCYGLVREEMNGNSSN